jgi:hypothetical protein
VRHRGQLDVGPDAVAGMDGLCQGIAHLHWLDTLDNRCQARSGHLR